MKRFTHKLNTRKRIISVLWLGAFVVLFSQTVLGQLVTADLPVTNGGFSAIVQDGNTLYLGGYFNYIGPNTGYGVSLDPASGVYDQTFPQVNDVVEVCIPDGRGGLYIGGHFTKVGTVFRNYVAHINADKTVDLTWNPNPNGSVKAIVLRGSRVYIGGYFTQLGSLSRNYAAAVDIVTGAPTAWDPDLNNVVFGIAVSDSFVYLGGNFTNINGGFPRSYIAAVDSVTGTATAWNPGASPQNGIESFIVKGLLLADNDSTLYVWGNLSQLGGVAKYGAGSVYTHPVGGVYTTAWAPNPRYTQLSTSYCPITSLAISGDTVFLGGEFTRLKTQYVVRNKIGAMTRTGVGTLLPWNPDITSPYFGVSTKVTGVTSLLLTDGVVYAGGYFTAVGGVARINLAAIDKATGLATTWDPHPADGENTFVNSISLMGNNVFAGGAFFSVNGVNRNCLAAVDLSTKQVTSWDPNVTLTGGGAIVSSMVEYGPNIYLSGAFDMIGGIPRGKFAAISKTTGLPVDFLSTTIFNYPVPYTLAVNNDKLYISGAFSTIGDSVRNNVASVDLITGNVTAWNPSLDIAGSSYYVRAFGFAGSTVYLSGDFETVGISFRKGLAAVDDTLGSVLPWNPNAGNGYTGFGFHGFAMDVSNSIVYVGGNFDTVGTTGRRGLAAIDAITGDVTAWNAELTVPLFTLGITSLKVAGSNLYIGGALTSVGANPRTAGIAAIDIPTATANSWNPQLGRPINPLTGTIFSFVLDGTNSLMYIAGNFTIINSDDPCYKFASIPIPAVIPTTFQLTVTVGDGWNMVSVPGVNPNGQGVENWWAGRIGNVYKYSAGYQVITTTTPGEGYWMKNNGNQTYNTGNEWPAGGIQYVPYDPISVVAGWNMLGGYDYNAAVSGITPAPQGSFYGFSGTGGYQAVTELVAGYGYWAKFASAGQITLPPPLFKGTSTVAKVIDDSWGKITITDNAGKNYTLYGISGEVDLNNYELPPLPPSGLFDIRYGSSRYAENLSAGQQTIQMQGIEYPVRIKVEGMRIQLQDAGGKIVNVSLSSGEELTIANNLVNKLVILSGEVTATLPIEYALEQNYPNPFNPSTSVQFLVPKEGLVTIKVYDMLGQEVATLFSGNAQGGTYTSNWNGKDNSGNFVSSGTYIYRMTVGDFTQSRKMLFLK